MSMPTRLYSIKVLSRAYFLGQLIVIIPADAVKAINQRFLSVHSA